MRIFLFETCLALIVAVAGGSTALAAIEDQNVPKEKEPEPPPPQVLTKPPELLQFVNARYPQKLLEAGVGGEVVMQIEIDAVGAVRRVEILQASEPDLATPALIAATQFAFSPAEINSIPAPIRIEYRYIFTPQAPEPDAIAGRPAATTPEVLPLNFVGVVLEAGVRNPIAGAVVSVNGRRVAQTDRRGRFEVRGLTPGNLTVVVSSPYHDRFTSQETLAPDERIEARYYLRRTSFDPYETVVRAKTERREVAKVQLDRKELEKVPGTFGDPIRVIENLPGLSRTPGGLGGSLLVRGANPSDTAVFIDGVQIPLLYHFGGLTSVVNSTFLERIDFYPGGFGPRYGSATAGIVDVVTRDLDCDQVRGSGKVDIIDSSAFLCVPADEWQVAGAVRRSYIDALLPVVLDALPRDEDEGVLTASPVYYDYQLKAGRAFGDQRFDVFAFGSDDRFKLVQSGSTEDINFDFGLHTAFHRLLLRHRWKLSDTLTLNSQVAPGVVLQEFEAQASEIGADNRFGLTIWSLGWREELAWKPLDYLTVNVGLDINFGSATLDIDAPFQTELRNFPTPTFNFTESQSFDESSSQYNHAYWAEAVFETDFGLKVIPGLRVDRWDFRKTQDYSFLPRLTLRWEFIEGSTVKGAAGLYEKLPQPNFLIDPFGNPNLPPQRTQQWILGFEQEFTDLISLDIQAFYNDRNRLPTQTTAETIEDGERTRENFSPDGTGQTYGIEVLLRHLATDNGWFYGWIAYTFSRSLRQDRAADQTVSFNQGQTPNVREERALVEYPSNFDQPHILTVVGQFVLPWGLEAGIRYRLVSGNPFTPVEQGEIFYDVDAGIYSVDLDNVERNSDRLPLFHQLDLRIDKTWTFDLWKFSAYVELLNAYNASNVEQYEYDYRYDRRVEVTFLPIIPVIGVKGEF